MSLFTNSFRKLSQQQQENDMVKVYYKTDMKLYAKVRYNRGTTVGQIIDELIKELNLNGKLQYQIYLLSHKKNEPSLGGISIKRKLRRNEQPFKILFLTKVYKFSFYLDYMLSQLSQNNYDSQSNQNENYQFTKYDKEFKIYKITKEGGQKQMKIKINSTGAALCQEGSKKWRNLLSILIANLISKKILYSQSLKNKYPFIELQIKMSFMLCNIVCNCSNKLIYQYTKNTEIKYKISALDNKIEHCTKQIMEQLESNCYEFISNKQRMKENPRFHIFFDIFKVTQVNRDISAIENDDMNINLEEFRESILETLSILPTEQFRKGLIVFNSQYKYTASCKIEDQIEEQNNNKLLQSLDSVVISEEDLRRYSQFLS